MSDLNDEWERYGDTTGNIEYKYVDGYMVFRVNPDVILNEAYHSENGDYDELTLHRLMAKATQEGLPEDEYKIANGMIQTYHETDLDPISKWMNEDKLE